jgi:hypothetical protein
VDVTGRRVIVDSPESFAQSDDQHDQPEGDGPAAQSETVRRHVEPT